MTELAILIINYKSPAYTIDCLQSLEEEHRGETKFCVWLLDNDSGDDSVALIRNAIHQNSWTPWVHFIESKKNLGFAGGNNFLMQQVNEQGAPPFILLLNNDTVVHPGCLTYTVNTLKKDPTIALMSCQLLNGDGSVQNIARKMPTPTKETLRALGLPYLFPRLFGWADLEDGDWDRKTTKRDVEWIGGAFMCMPLKTATQTGLFDTDFFFYGEDIELCHRIRKLGGRIYFDYDATVTHFGGASSDPKRLINRRRDILHWKARFLVQKKCFGPLAAHWSHLMYIISFAGRKVLAELRGQRGSETHQNMTEGLYQLTHLNTDQST